MRSGFVRSRGDGRTATRARPGIPRSPQTRSCRGRKTQRRFCPISSGGRVCVRGGVQFAGVVRKNRSVPSPRRFTAQPISCGDLAYSFVFVFSSCCFPSQAFPFVVLENEKNAISPSSPPEFQLLRSGDTPSLWPPLALRELGRRRLNH